VNINKVKDTPSIVLNLKDRFNFEALKELNRETELFIQIKAVVHLKQNYNYKNELVFTYEPVQIKTQQFITQSLE